MRTLQAETLAISMRREQKSEAGRGSTIRIWCLKAPSQKPVQPVIIVA